MFIAAAQVEDECDRIVLLDVGQQEVQKERLAASGCPEDERVGDVAAVQVQKVGRPMFGFEDG